MRNTSLVLLFGGALFALPDTAHAFCGFFVSGGGAELFNDATQVVLMRDGLRTVMSMQNNYRGPAEDFAMVIPVPVVLAKENVRTLPSEVFARIDAITAPRLVEYWNGQCGGDSIEGMAAADMPMKKALKARSEYGVRVEAQFKVDEYEIVILSADDSTGLDRWLFDNHYKIPKGAEPHLRPYVQGGWKFFVAKVDVEKVAVVDGQTVLSPLRFHFDNERFSLPIRLGLINSPGIQDLIVTVIGRWRYEIANRTNVFIPTNVELTEAAMSEFGPFYAELVKHTFKKNPGAAITEFAWSGALPPPRRMQQRGIYGVTCDPCPPPSPVDDPLAKLLGAEVIPRLSGDEDIAKFARESTITRLHMRYKKGVDPADLIFRSAPAIAGGIPGWDQPRPTSHNRFQARYIVRHNACQPWGRGFNAMTSAPGLTAMAAPGQLSRAFETYLARDVPELDLRAFRREKVRPLIKN